MVFVAGPPGIGKTALATRVLAVAAASGAHTAAARVDPGGVVPFSPIREVVRELIGAESVVDALTPSEDPFTQLERRSNVPPAPTALVARAVANRLRRSPPTGGRLVLDDFHFATADTIELLRCVLAATSMGRTFIVVTYRDTDLAANIRCVAGSARSSKPNPAR